MANQTVLLTLMLLASCVPTAAMEEDAWPLFLHEDPWVEFDEPPVRVERRIPGASTIGSSASWDTSPSHTRQQRSTYDSSISSSSVNWPRGANTPYRETWNQFKARLNPPVGPSSWMIWNQQVPPWMTWDQQDSQGRPWELPGSREIPAAAMGPNMGPKVYRDGEWFTTTEIRATLVCMALSASVSVARMFGIREAALTILATSSTARAGRVSRQRMIQALIFATGFTDGCVRRPAAHSDDGNPSSGSGGNSAASQ